MNTVYSQICSPLDVLDRVRIIKSHYISPPVTQFMKCDEAAEMFIWRILIQVNEHVACVCVCVRHA